MSIYRATGVFKSYVTDDESVSFALPRCNAVRATMTKPSTLYYTSKRSQLIVLYYVQQTMLRLDDVDWTYDTIDQQQYKQYKIDVSDGKAFFVAGEVNFFDTLGETTLDTSSVLHTIVDSGTVNTRVERWQVPDTDPLKASVEHWLAPEDVKTELWRWRVPDTDSVKFDVARWTVPDSDNAHLKVSGPLAADQTAIPVSGGGGGSTSNHVIVDSFASDAIVKTNFIQYASVTLSPTVGLPVDLYTIVGRPLPANGATGSFLPIGHAAVGGPNNSYAPITTYHVPVAVGTDSTINVNLESVGGMNGPCTAAAGYVPTDLKRLAGADTSSAAGLRVSLKSIQADPNAQTVRQLDAAVPTLIAGTVFSDATTYNRSNLTKEGTQWCVPVCSDDSGSSPGLKVNMVSTGKPNDLNPVQGSDFHYRGAVVTPLLDGKYNGGLYTQDVALPYCLPILHSLKFHSEGSNYRAYRVLNSSGVPVHQENGLVEVLNKILTKIPPIEEEDESAVESKPVPIPKIEELDSLYFPDHLSGDDS